MIPRWPSCLVLTGLAALPGADPAVVTVRSDGPGAAARLQAAIDALPADQTAIIHLLPGSYTGRIVIPRGHAHLTLQGDDAATTILTIDQGINAVDDHGAKLGTMRSATLDIVADDVTCEGLTLANTAGRTAGQALALAAQGDRLVFRHCRMEGWQDTVRAEGGREYWEDCTISGHCDYIYGSATAWFERCTIIQKANGFISAASTPEDHAFGLVFAHCTVIANPDATGFFLGRPWRPFAHTLFLHCALPAGVKPAGWFNWDKPEREKTARYQEYGNTGPGADTTRRVPWSRQLGDEQARSVTVAAVLAGTDGWDPCFQGRANSSR